MCADLASGLDPSRFRSSAAVVDGGWLYDTLVARGVDTSITRMGRGGFDVGYMRRLATIARQQRASLIQSHLLTTNLYGGMVARLLGIPAIAAFHGMVDIAPDDRLARVKLRLITSCVSRLVFVSRALRRHFQSVYAVPEHRTVVVPNGIDADYFRPAPNRKLRAELGFADDVVIVGAVGNIRQAKGYDDLLTVAAVLRDDHPAIRFVIAGDPNDPIYARLIARRLELGLVDRVIFLGFRDQVAEFLNGIDLYISTSVSEGFSLTTVQAMACGRAVVATRSGGPDEIISNGTDGLLAAVGDPTAVASAVAACASDASLRRTLGERGRETVLRSFTRQRMIAAYEEIYEDALQGV